MEKLENLLNKNIKELKDNKLIKTEELSDTYHTFGQLYHDRAILFAIILNSYKERAWKSKQHHDGTMFGEPNEMFIVGVDTSEGQFTYHYHMKYWDIYNVKEVEKAPEFDGHTYKNIDRLFSLLRGVK